MAKIDDKWHGSFLKNSTNFEEKIKIGRADNALLTGNFRI